MKEKSDELKSIDKAVKREYEASYGGLRKADDEALERIRALGYL